MRIALITIFQFLFVGKAISQINNEHLKIGENAPKIIGVDQFDSEIDSDKILQEKKILLIFYRGSWCPYCKKHLSSLQENLEKLTEKGIHVIVVTPEKVDKIKSITKKMNSSFSIIHDTHNKIMNDYKVAFNVTKESVPKYFEFTMKRIQEYNENDNNVLPVPATYLISRDKKIRYVHYNPDYSKRSNFNDILAMLE